MRAAEAWREYTSANLQPMDGPYETFDAGGWLAQRAHFKEGVLDGELVQFDADGNTLAVMHYADGKLEGESVFFDRGQPQLRMQYRNGLQEGETIVYGANGLPTAKAEYRAGKLDGLSSWFRPDGTLLRTANFVDGHAGRRSGRIRRARTRGAEVAHGAHDGHVPPSPPRRDPAGGVRRDAGGVDLRRGIFDGESVRGERGFRSPAQPRGLEARAAQRTDNHQRATSRARRSLCASPSSRAKKTRKRRSRVSPRRD